MKKNIITKIMAVALAVITAVSPVTADAAEKKVVTREDYQEFRREVSDAYEAESMTDEECDETIYNYVESLNGCYNEDGIKIVTVLNGKTKKITKTGKYDVVVGGKTAKKDQGTIKFVAPKTGTYKFTFTVKGNVTGQNVCIFPKNNNFNKMKRDYWYTSGGEVHKTDNSAYILLAVDGVSYSPATGTYLDKQPTVCSKMKTMSGTIKLKKGQSIILECRNPKADLDETYAYKFTDFVVSISKVK